MNWLRRLSFLLGLAATSLGAQGTTTGGRIAGRVLDAASGQPITGARIAIGDSVAAVVSDLDGRFRTPLLRPGRYRVIARRLGMQPKQYDSIAVTDGQTTLVNFALSQAAVALQTVVVNEARGDRATSEAGLLAVQQKAASATDGISSEQISRSTDSDAGQAATRVPGVSIVGSKFVVVRGLSERYSNTLLNGVEVASPEPTKKIVPMDIFPASLIDGIVVTKSATPDKPGDFAGGSVEIKTKEFPEEFVLQYNVSLGHNSLVTGKRADLPNWRGLDFAGWDAGGRRKAPPLPASFEDPTDVERYEEGLRNTWAPPMRRVLPDIGFGVNLGDQRQWGTSALGYLFSVTYSNKNELQPDRLFQFLLDPSANPARGYVYRERRTSADWGTLFNTSVRLGSNHKFGWKNLYTRNAEEQYVTNEGFNIDLNGAFRGFQYSYITRDLLQSQLVGEHLGHLFVPWRAEWKATWSESHRDEPDNRQVPYVRPVDDSSYFMGNNSDFWFRYLDDTQRNGQVDFSVPLPWFGSRDVMVKTGGLARRKVREFDASLAALSLNGEVTLPSRFGTLTPERLFQPENLGTFLQVNFPGNLAQPYSADDDLLAVYGMLDLPVLSWLRIVGGVRLEDWRLDLFDGGRARFAEDTTLQATVRRNKDLLWSGNATIALGSRMNVRLAAFKTLARPDTRELSQDEYVDIVGGCPTIGNPTLQRTLVTNGDARWEWYPGPGEVVAVSGFYKYFELPIIRAVTGDNNCRFTFNNGIDATNLGAEIDIRKGLTFLPGALGNIAIGLNGTYVQSTLTIDSRFGVYDSDLQLEDQSPFLFNGNVNYVDSRGRFEASMLYNWFGDRISRYGFRSGGGTASVQGPNIVEDGRGTLDVKVQWRALPKWRVTVSGKNLTDNRIAFHQDTDRGRIRTGLARGGIGISLGVGYDR
ncbi:MAG: TonB-dependent receptor [Cytophagaceae bacterium]|nr:TonB-dependent receptor [Gemmatimonadaceae bacterium]